MADEPATKPDLETAIAVTFRQSEDRMKKFSRDLQTEVLRAIYENAESGNRRMTALERSDIGLTERFAALENRVLGIEKRLNLPLGAAA
jgi:S-adenosylmethionine:diacylglycerol 3-amino-3-carboxypropyl transferase